MVRGVVTYYLSPIHQRVFKGYSTELATFAKETAKDSAFTFWPACLFTLGLVSWAGKENERIRYEQRP